VYTETYNTVGSKLSTSYTVQRNNLVGLRNQGSYQRMLIQHERTLFTLYIYKAVIRCG